MRSMIAAGMMLVLAGNAGAQTAPPANARPVSEDTFLGIATYRLWDGDAPGAVGKADLDVPTLTVFRPHGTVSAGNASGITDGAAALLVASQRAAAQAGLQPFGYLTDWEVVGVEPRIMGIGPVPAVRGLLARSGKHLADFDAMELNEAFASQVLACLKELDIDPAKVNPDGGAIALGHPIGATGARIVVTLLHGLAAHGRRHGIATLCVSGGMGFAASVELP